MTTALKRLFASLVLLCLVLVPGAGFAAQQVDALPPYAGASESDNPTLAAGETVEGPVFYAGENVTLDGDVNGTAFAAGQTVTINGRIDGDLFAAASVVNIRGQVTGNIYAAGSTVNFDGQTEKDVFAAGATVLFGKESASRDAFVAGTSADLAGTIDRRLFAGAATASLQGTIGSDVYASTESLSLQDGAVIQGNLYYEGAKEASVAPGAVIEGDHQWAQMSSGPENSMEGPPSIVEQILSILFLILSGLVIWAIFRGLRPHGWEGFTAPLEAMPLKTLALGLLAALVLPVLFILLLITVIGIPAAFVLLIGASLLAALSKIITAAGISHLLIDRYNFPALHAGLWSFLAVFTVLVLLGQIPYLGILISLLSIFVAFGLIVMHAFVRPFRQERQVALNPALEDDIAYE